MELSDIAFLKSNLRQRNRYSPHPIYFLQLKESGHSWASLTPHLPKSRSKAGILKARSTDHGNSRLVTISPVESIPGRVSGAWVFRDTRLPVATVIENLRI
jgi:hypothetical protein